MAHTATNPQVSSAHSGTLIAIVLASVMGFALGQAWPATGYSPQPQIVSEIEDWHGNVRRSNWSQ